MPGRSESLKTISALSPGPAAYEVKDPKVEFKKQVFSFSKEPKGKEGKQKPNPGPGQYDSRNDKIMKRSSPSWG